MFSSGAARLYTGPVRSMAQYQTVLTMFVPAQPELHSALFPPAVSWVVFAGPRLEAWIKYERLSEQLEVIIDTKEQKRCSWRKYLIHLTESLHLHTCRHITDASFRCLYFQWKQLDTVCYYTSRPEATGSHLTLEHTGCSSNNQELFGLNTPTCGVNIRPVRTHHYYGLWNIMLAFRRWRVIENRVFCSGTLSWQFSYYL